MSSARRTDRTIAVLNAVRAHPGATNTDISYAAAYDMPRGRLDTGQLSKLLSRLEARGLIVNNGPHLRRGSPNEWEITTVGVKQLEAWE